MNRGKKTYCMLAAALLLLASAPVPAQEVTFNRFEQNLRHNFWQECDNPAGIRQDSSVARISYAELYGKMSAGGFRQSYEASLPWSVGARVRTLVHLSRFSMQGSFGFEQGQGADMCGSMFTEPGRYPIDALEFTPGKKVRQTYSFDGSISIDVAEHWMLGAGLDFRAVNIAKRKDLRHSNYLLDLTLSPGVIWHKDALSVGFNAILGKNSDCPKAEQVGSKETFDAFLNKGLWYGKFEGWEGSGLHLDEAGVSGLPVRETCVGAGIQVSRETSGLGMMAGVDYRHGNGTIGEKQYIWYRFPSNDLSLRLALRFNGGDYVHRFRLNAVRSFLINKESVIEKVTEGGVSTTVIHGSNPILWRNSLGANVEYSFERDCDEFTVVFSAADVVSTAAQMYPYVASETFGTLALDAGYRRRLGPVDLSVKAGVYGGNVREEDYRSDEESGVSTEPYRLEQYWLLDKEYRTATRLSVGAGAVYDFWKGLYLRADADYVRAFGVSVLPGADRVNLIIGLGYRF